MFFPSLSCLKFLSSTIMAILIPLSVVSGAELLGTYIVLRHGERTPYPLVAYPKYVINASQWKNGPGNLSDPGIRQTYAFGTFVSKRYSKILNRTIVNGDIWTSSSNASMTQSTALAFHYGFNQTLYGQNLIRKILSLETDNLTSIHVEDDLLLVSLKKCLNHVQALNTHHNKPSSRYSLYVMDYWKVFQDIVRITGLEIKSPLHMISLADTTLCHRLNNFSLPTNITEEIYYVSQTATDILFADMYRGEKGMTKDCYGFLGKKILDSMKERIRINSGTQSTAPGSGDDLTEVLKRPIILYSAHDITLVGLMAIFDIYVDHRPPPTSAFVIELWKSDPSAKRNGSDTRYSHTVKFYYKKGHVRRLLKVKKDIRYDVLKGNIKTSLVDLPDIIHNCIPYPPHYRGKR